MADSESDSATKERRVCVCFSLQSRQICLAVVMVAMGIGAYSDSLLNGRRVYGHRGAVNQGRAEFVYRCWTLVRPQRHQ